MSLFTEEQLDSPAGYFPAQPSQTLDNGRWTITRKLGWGPRSSTWLALDNGGRYGAIKIFTVEATEDSTGANERKMLLGPVKNVPSGVPEILSDFYEHDSNGKRHLCLVLRVLGPSVENLRLSNTYDGEYLLLHSVQKIVGDISTRLGGLAEEKIVHGAVTADNFLFWSIQAGDDIRRELAKSPSARAEKVVGSDGVTYSSVKSQPFPNGFTWDSPKDDIICAQLYLSNYAYAGSTGGAVKLGGPKNVQPPEALKGERIDHKSDIWMLGCTTYHLLTGSPLFSDSYIESPISVATETVGKLESLLTESGKLSEKDIPPTVAFLRSCLAIKPAKRVSAAEILQGSWVFSGCSCGWCG
ncbi:kinase-like domain-containing protein [Crassisporium funariophilum]|nr:kinase-like domain-containing protein [Crassisporium funariophilum]